TAAASTEKIPADGSSSLNPAAAIAAAAASAAPTAVDSIPTVNELEPRRPWFGEWLPAGSRVADLRLGSRFEPGSLTLVEIAELLDAMQAYFHATRLHHDALANTPSATTPTAPPAATATTTADASAATAAAATPPPDYNHFTCIKVLGGRHLAELPDRPLQKGLAPGGMSGGRAASRRGRSRIRPAAESAHNDPPKLQQQSRALSLAGSLRRRCHPCRAASSSARPDVATTVSSAAPAITAAVRRSSSRPSPKQTVMLPDTRVPSSAGAAASASPVQLGKALVAAAVIFAI
ncbi:hypothetical protein HK405_000362, partial [Cladochytrium tenue]